MTAGTLMPPLTQVLGHRFSTHACLAGATWIHGDHPAASFFRFASKDRDELAPRSVVDRAGQQQQRKAGNSCRKVCEVSPLMPAIVWSGASVGGKCPKRCTWSGRTTNSMISPPSSGTISWISATRRSLTSPVSARGCYQHHMGITLCWGLHRSSLYYSMRIHPVKGGNVPRADEWFLSSLGGLDT